MRNILNVIRQYFYIYVDSSEKVDEYAEKVTKVFYDSHVIYVTRKIKGKGVLTSKKLFYPLDIYHESSVTIA
uniref:Ribonuclease HII n=1 Tax=Erysipelothrix rhusiopathiae TaxID=1648 RepID=A0A2Z6FZ15_ERYRH|nr:ribonuclease HII [Erysipelothrix rhusiopathiae]